MDLDKHIENSEFKAWIQRRIQALNNTFSVYDWLSEHGIELFDKYSNLQIKCPFPEHGPDNDPSARYYAQDGGLFHCFKCKYHFTNSAALHSKWKNISFMDALSELERRFRISVPLKPEDISLPDFKIRDHKYVSDKWNDVPRMADLLEQKLRRIKNSASMIDYIKYCRILDYVVWDFNHNGNKSTIEMINILKKLKLKLEEKNDDLSS